MPKPNPISKFTHHIRIPCGVLLEQPIWWWPANGTLLFLTMYPLYLETEWQGKYDLDFLINTVIMLFLLPWAPVLGCLSGFAMLRSHRQRGPGEIVACNVILDSQNLRVKAALYE